MKKVLFILSVIIISLTSCSNGTSQAESLEGVSIQTLDELSAIQKSDTLVVKYISNSTETVAYAFKDGKLYSKSYLCENSMVFVEIGAIIIMLLIIVFLLLYAVLFTT